MSKEENKEKGNRKCKVFYNQGTGQFYFMLWDNKSKEWIGSQPADYKLIIKESIISKAQPFTDMIDAMKILFGYKEFNLPRLKALWNAYTGKHDLFSSELSAYFFPVNSVK